MFSGPLPSSSPLEGSTEWPTIEESRGEERLREEGESQAVLWSLSNSNASHPHPHPSNNPHYHNVHLQQKDHCLIPDYVAPDESWLVTPPACFTLGGSSPHRMEENPLENLLIEHSSMSVYGDSKENISQVETAQPSKTRASAKKDVVKKGDNNKDGELSEAFIKQELKVEFLKRVRENLPRQKARKAKEHRDNSKKQMHRLNKTPVRPVLSQRNVTRKFISQPGKRC